MAPSQAERGKARWTSKVVEMVINPAYQSQFSTEFFSELEEMKGKVARYEIKTYP